MRELRIALGEDVYERLEAVARQHEMTAEELAKMALTKLAEPLVDEEFKQALDYVLKKNAELYRRLS